MLPILTNVNHSKPICFFSYCDVTHEIAFCSDTCMYTVLVIFMFLHVPLCAFFVREGKSYKVGIRCDSSGTATSNSPIKHYQDGSIAGILRIGVDQMEHFE